MMMPSLPRAHLIVGQTRLSFGTLERFFDAVLGLEDTGEFSKGVANGAHDNK